ncbi:MAG: ABC transporter ATP-binding protein [Pseudomonadales bacterium]|nr:ABC transporter ATP-binding protein [Pseudomonadales bacterium]MBO6597942.1 ABC transporter ATP-binding protein [Pseudomonadales bacterium]MBO6823036.1 ABC transporter ATP-binding protein [Pseudomonadales bacterium]
MIEVSHLSKHYGDFVAVNDLSFRLVPGDILGFLGPNGAGKSTTMKMLTGFLRPTSGDISIWGSDVWTDTLAAQSHIGYLPEGAPAYEEMTPLGFLNFIAEARGLSGPDRDDAVSKASATMSLESVLNQKIETLSKGFKRRVGMAQAILHDPDVLILDEPTDGLDPNQKHEVREMIKGLSKEKIVIVSTHILEEVTAVCNRVMVLAGGAIVSDGAPEDLLTLSRHHGAVTLELIEITEELTSAFQSLDGVDEVEREDNRLTLMPASDVTDLFSRVMSFIREKDVTVTAAFVEQGRLDDVFRTLTEGDAQ